MLKENGDSEKCVDKINSVVIWHVREWTQIHQI
jgi:hypothetical protein